MDSSRLTLLSLAVLSSLFLVSAVYGKKTTPRLETPQPLSLSENPSARWFVTNNVSKCILANFTASFLVNYNATEKVDDFTYLRNATVVIPPSAVVNETASSCSVGVASNVSTMAIVWMNGNYSYEVRLFFTAMGGVYNRTVLDGVHLHYNLMDEAVFPNATNVSNVWERVAKFDGEVAMINNDSYLKCDSGVQVTMEETLERRPVWATAVDVKLEAFRASSTSTFDDNVQVCPGDQVTSTVEPTTTSTTTESTTTSSATTETSTETTSSTTPRAPGPAAHWAVSDPITGDNCILANFTTTFIIQYEAVMNSTGDKYQRNASLTVPQTATVSKSSICNSGTLYRKAVLALEWTNNGYNYGLQIDFNMTGSMDNKTIVSGIHLQYDLGDASVFHEAANISNVWQRNADGLGEIATIGHGDYLKCDSGLFPTLNETLEGEPVWASMTGVRLEAFRTSKTSTFDDTEVLCPGDEVISTTTFVPSSTTPKPGTGKTYQLNDTTGVCLEAHFNLDLNVLYYSKDDGKVINETFNDLNNGTVLTGESYCDVNKSRLAIGGLLPHWTLYYTFTHNTDKFALESVRLDFNLTNFARANYTDAQTTTTENLSNTWGAHLNKSYMCNVMNEWHLNKTMLQGINDIVLKLENVHVQAFMHNGIFDQAEECSADNGPGGDTSQIVPIAVGCALAALVIIVLIAYVIGRRRNRARGYESM